MRLSPLRALLATLLLLPVSVAIAAPRQATPVREVSSLSIQPLSGPPGTTVTLSASPRSLPAGALAFVNFSDPASIYPGAPLGEGLVGTDGSLSIHAKLPSEATFGNGTVFVTANAVTISTAFSIQTQLAADRTTLTPSSTVELTGNGFSRARAITISAVDSSGKAPQLSPLVDTPITTSIYGTFNAQVVIPKNVPLGTLSVSATDYITTGSVDLQVVGPAAMAGPATGGAATLPPSSTPAPSTTVTPTTAPASMTTAYFAEGYTGTIAGNGKASFDETLNILNPTVNSVPFTLTYYLQGSTTPLVLTRSITATTTMRESVNADVGADKVVAAAISSPQRLFISRTIMRVSPAGIRLDASTTLPTLQPATSWGFPEGYTGFTFQEYLTVLNPGTVSAHMTVTLAPQSDRAPGVAARRATITVAPQSRSTVNIRAINAKTTTTAVGMLITSDQPIVPERVEYFGDGTGSGKFGSTVSSGITTPANQLRLTFGEPGAQGSQPATRQDIVTILNPSASGATIAVQATFADASGHGIGQTTVSVAPGTRRTIVVETVLGHPVSGAYSVTLNANGQIEAEGVQYFGGTPNAGTHPGVAFAAQAGTATDISFSDLATQLADGTAVMRTVYLYNPGTAPVQIAASYFDAVGTSVQSAYTVAAGSILAVPVGGSTLSTLQPGPLGAEFTLTGPGGSSFLATEVGLTADGLAATEDAGSAS